MSQPLHYDVAIVGGGPSGSTVGTLLRKYAPDLKVLVLEREKFPREHVGESLLPLISGVLNEMAVWDKVEAANFPIKVGATYKWGKASELWDFNFLPVDKFVDEERPAQFRGQRTRTSFQVDRSLYDKILLDHAAESGCEVKEETRVLEVLRNQDRVTGLRLETGEMVTADWYCDASGHSGILRRAMDVGEQIPTSLQNIAIYDYWQDADWAVSIGVGGTRIQVLSLGFGWIWFIPVGPTRTSVGLVVPASYYKKSSMRREELYEWALAEEPRVKALLRNATREGKLTATKDWSFIADRTCGENWFLLGEAAGFADPILSAGVTMAHMSGREAAYTILELERGEHDRDWLRKEFDRRQRLRIKQHIRFADYWYAGNGCFSELKEFAEDIAKDAGLNMTPEEAWRWIAQGGFVDEDSVAGTSFFSLRALEAIGGYITDSRFQSPLEKFNIFDLDLAGAETYKKAHYENGKITSKLSYRRGAKLLPMEGAYRILVQILLRERFLPDISATLNRLHATKGRDPDFAPHIPYIFQALEALVNDGWVKPSCDPRIPLMPPLPRDPTAFAANTDRLPV